MSEELSIFDMGVQDVISEEEKKKEQAQKDSIAARAKTVVAPKKKKEPVFVQADWSIHFATEHFFVNDFVDEIPEEGVTLEVVREGIERVFPQFSAARTKWDVDKENKRLFPDAFAGSKGSVAVKEGRFTPSFFVTAEEAFEHPEKVNRYLLSGDGTILIIKQSACGTMIAPTNQFKVEDEIVQNALSKLGYTSIKKCPIIPPSFEWILPKIPNSILRTIVGFFRNYIKESNQYEVALKIYWDLEQKKYVVDCPKQTVTPVNITLEHNEQFTGRNSLRYLPVMEVHSHNVMRAFFSGIDDKDEQAFNTTFGVFGVFGRLNRENYEMVFRAKMKNDSIEIKPEQLFDLTVDRKDYSFPKHWKSLVTTQEGFYL